MTRLLTYNDDGDASGGFTITDNGTVVVDTAIKFEGANSIRFDTTGAYRQFEQTLVLARWYYFAFLFRPGSTPSLFQNLFRAVDTAGNAAVNVAYHSSDATLRLTNAAQTQIGAASGVLDLDYWTLIEVGWQQQAAGNGSAAMWVNGEQVVAPTSATLTNTVVNRLRCGRPTNSAVIDSVHLDRFALNDDQGAAPDNFWVHPTPIPPGEPAQLRNPANGRRLSIPIGTTQVNGVNLRQADDRFAIRFVPDDDMRLYRWWSGFNIEGVYTDEAGAAAPAELRTDTLDKQTVNAGYAPTPVGLPGGWSVGTGRIDYAHGNGGTIRAELVTCNEDGTPDLTNVLASEDVNAVTRWIAADALLATISNAQSMLYFTFDVDVVGGVMYAIVFSNVDPDPMNNFFSTNSPLASEAAAGPHAENTTSKFAEGAMAGLDPRECCIWSIDGGDDWWFGRAVGGDTAAEGMENRPGGHIFGYYIGSGDSAVKLPWYGFGDSGGVRNGIQPYYNYVSQGGGARLVCKKAGRDVVLTEAGGYSPLASNVGIVTVKNEFTGVQASTASLGSGLAKGALSQAVPVTAGETFSITISGGGNVWIEEADDFLVKAFALGTGNFPFTTDGNGADRAALFALPWPYFAEQGSPLVEIQILIDGVWRGVV